MTLLLTLIVLVLLALALYTAVETRRIAARNPPIGRMIRVDGIDLHVVDVPLAAPRAVAGRTDQAGAGREPPALLFLHGASGNLLDLHMVFAPALAGRYRMVFVDRPGHGHSARGDRHSASPIRQAEIAGHLLDQLGIGRAIIIGHSWGGSVAAAMGLVRPDLVAGLVFLAAATHPWDGRIPFYYRLSVLPLIGPLFAHTLAMPIGKTMIKGAVRGAFTPGEPPANYASAIGADMVLRPKEFLANARDVARLLKHVRAMAPHYGDITARATVITGDSDNVVYEEIHSEGLARDIPGAKLTWLPGVGHMPHHTDPDAVIAAIREIAEQDPAKPAGAAG